MKLPSKVIALLLSAVFVAVLLWWFQPWRLITQSTVSEALPTSIVQSESQEIDSIEQSEGQSKVTFPVALLEGDLITHEHETSGVVKILELEDGSRILRLEGLETSDGPDLEVWLSNAPVIEGYDGWFLADDDDYLSLGKLKATSGDQNYEIPEGIDLSRFSSMSIWCVRFAVSFGAAELVDGESN